ncbi:hypothetical protein ACE1CI_01585 [Aerosakkonemataceae cyanobacterium BLCC-F50]|uniref:Uncharacterized protein n=1 Tax=Floridaenema flaviceps BLCC-F50 TaxID=3153642 RepID=A0ABV4XIS3_9CYAN
MDELDRRLQELVSQAQLYSNNPPRRRKIIQDLWDTMLPSSNLRGRQPKLTDGEAKRRLAGLKKWCANRYGANIEGDLEEDWSDVLGEVQKEVLIKIDIYNRGVDFQLFKEWQKFRQKLQSNRNPDVYLEFQQPIESFRCRFEQRRTKKGKRTYPAEKAQRLAQTCKTFGDRIQNTEVDLQQAWDSFCNEIQQLYRPLKFWNWFAYYIKNRFIDLIRKRFKEVSGDAPDANQEEDSTTQTRFDKVQAKADLMRSPEVIKIIYEDPDGIFMDKPIENLPQINFREIALLKYQDATLEEIQRHFGIPERINDDGTVNRRYYAQQTISPFYSRTCCYFKPIIEEYLEARLCLPETALTAIINDENGRFQKKRMPSYPSMNFKYIILRRVSGVPSWKVLAQELQLEVKDLIYFYLDCIRYFKLIQLPKTRTRKNKNSILSDI